MEWYKILESWKIIQNSLERQSKHDFSETLRKTTKSQTYPSGGDLLARKSRSAPSACQACFVCKVPWLNSWPSQRHQTSLSLSEMWVGRPYVASTSQRQVKTFKKEMNLQIARRKTACAVFPLESDANTPGAPKKKKPKINIDAEGNPQWHKKAKYQQSRSPPLWERMEKQLSSLTSIESQQPSTSTDQNFSLASVVASSLVPLHGRQAVNKTLESLPGIQRIITTCDVVGFAKSEIILESRSGTLFVMHTSRKEPSVPFAIKKKWARCTWGAQWSNDLLQWALIKRRANLEHV